MAFLGIKITEDVAKHLKKISVPGKKEKSSEYHITILYLGENINLDTITNAIKATYKVCEKFNPFEIWYDMLTCFPSENDKGLHPIILRVKSEELMKLFKKLSKHFDKEDIFFSKKFDYNPHTTLSYSRKPIEEKSIKPIKMQVSELVLWAGDEGDEKMSITFSLQGNDKKASLEEKINNFLKVSSFKI